MPRRRVSVEPHVILATCHPDYRAEQDTFVHRCIDEQFRGYCERAAERKDIRALRPGADLSEEPMSMPRLVAHLALKIGEGDIDAVFRVIRILGLWGAPDDHAIQQAPNPTAKAILRVMQIAQRRAQDKVEEWAGDATFGTPADQQRARRLLRRIPDALMLLPARGGRVGKGSPFVVTHAYWAEVFRWTQARQLLHRWPGSRRDKVDAVRSAYDVDGLCREIRLRRRVDPQKGIVTEDQLLGYLGVHPDGTLTGDQPLPPEQIAEIVVAKMYNLTVPRVANLVSDHPRFALLQGELMTR